MTEERDPKPAEESTAAATAARQRKKRKWDQPAESLISAGLSVTGTLPLGTGGIIRLPIPGTIPSPGSVITNQVPAISSVASQLFQPSFISQNSAAIVQKLTQPKIQDELIAREIVINDAEPTIRYKLTKRQTQEEIQSSTGAVVITRGKYHPPDALPDSEKPLYLLISAGAHLKDTAERIKAVDRAASMVDDILKQGQTSLPVSTPFHSAMSNGQFTQPLSTFLFLGFETDPSLNIAARIRGPNDQYINHIMNETGATVVLRGRGSGNLGNISVEEAQQPLHLFLSSTNPKSLEAARSLAENLLDTISAECGASRISPSKVYSAVPPPQQLLSGVKCSGEVLGVNANPAASLPCTAAVASTGSTGSDVSPPGSVLRSGGVPNYGNPQPQMVSYSHPSVSGGTYYSGYGGIYPQATPLQQVALALRKAPALTAPAVASAVGATTAFVSTASAVISSQTTSSSLAETERRPPQKRKFQELPVASNETVTHHQSLLKGSDCLKPGTKDSDAWNVSTPPPPPKQSVHTESDGMPPPPPRSMPPPPPKFTASRSPLPLPPKFASPGSAPQIEKSQDPVRKQSNDEPLPDPLLKLAEYGEEDDDIEALGEEYLKSNFAQKPSSKPFWAV